MVICDDMMSNPGCPPFHFQFSQERIYRNPNQDKTLTEEWIHVFQNQAYDIMPVFTLPQLSPAKS